MTEYVIYCAGPLFNPSERAEMEMLAETLQQAGFKTFLPHRDGFLFEVIVPALARAGYEWSVAQWLARQAIFALDVFQVLVNCHGTVVNLNGRVPDEGAVVEGAMAWTAGKPIVLYKDDVRSKIDGLDNPLVAGLGDFHLVRRSEDLPGAMTRALTAHPPEFIHMESLPEPIRLAAGRGQRLMDSYGSGDLGRLLGTIAELFESLIDFRSNPRHLPH